MKRPAYLLLVLVICFPAFAQADGVFFATVAEAPPSCADSTCTGFAVCENAEGTGTPSGWVADAGVDFDDTTSPVLRGSQQLMLVWDSVAKYAYVDVDAAGTYYGFYNYKTADITPAATKEILHLRDSLDNTIYKISLRTDGTLRITHGNQSTETTGGMSSDNTEYHIWYRFTRGNGVGVGWVEWTNGTTYAPTGSGNNYVYIDWGNGDADVTRLVVLESAGDASYYDQVLLRTTAIGQVCE